LSRIIPHYTTLDKFTDDKINFIMLGKIISFSFILFTGTGHIFTGIDAIEFK
jgi:hypothetical protein